MAIEIKAPTYPESVQEGTLATWHKQPGDTVSRDELIVDIETDKVVLEVVAPASGVLAEVLKAEGDIVLSNEILARIEEGVVAAASPAVSKSEPDAEVGGVMVNPAAKKLADERNIDLSEIAGTGKGGRITKEDVVNYSPAAPSAPVVAKAAPADSDVTMPVGERVERRVAMTRMRSRISERLMSVTQSTAMLTTFNEVDMSAMMGLRKQYQDEFTKMHNGTRLGF
ncbi:MAG: E3 binding domain-containing protein, partial [Porticoccaceae bacterium]|nr:E3 binding domain-containing protein [Porticoccaceae bacterium]